MGFWVTVTTLYLRFADVARKSKRSCLPVALLDAANLREVRAQFRTKIIIGQLVRLIPRQSGLASSCFGDLPFDSFDAV